MRGSKALHGSSALLKTQASQDQRKGVISSGVAVNKTGASSNGAVTLASSPFMRMRSHGLKEALQQPRPASAAPMGSRSVSIKRKPK